MTKLVNPRDFIIDVSIPGSRIVTMMLPDNEASTFYIDFGAHYGFNVAMLEYSSSKFNQFICDAFEPYAEYIRCSGSEIYGKMFPACSNPKQVIMAIDGAVNL